MKRKNVLRLLLFLLLASGIAVAYHYVSGLFSEMEAIETAPPILVSHPVKIQRGTIEDALQASGTLQPFAKLDVGVQVSGQIKSIAVNLGDRVKKGDSLATIDPTIAMAELHEKESSLSQQKAELATRQLDLEQAIKELARQRRLEAHEAISKVELDDSELKFRRAGIALESFKAQLKQSEAAVESARTKLKYTEITAPIDGDIINIAAQTGQTLIASQQAPVLMTIAQLDKLMVIAQVPEADIDKLYKGQTVYFTTLKSGSKPILGKVEAIRPTAKIIKDAVFYEVISSLNNTDRKLLSDMSVQINFVFKVLKNVLVIPLSAVGAKHASEDKYLAFVMSDTGKSIEKYIKIGSDDHIQAQVLEGLNEGDQVIDPYVANTKDKK